MKHVAYITLFLALAAAGCKQKDKKQELAELKKQQVTEASEFKAEQAKLTAKIEALEKELGLKDTVVLPEVTAVKVDPAVFASYIEVQGAVDAEENVNAFAEAPGMINAIFAQAGQQVKKGQVIATLDNRTLEQQIQQAESQVELANTLFGRQKNLWDQKIGTEVQFLQAKTNRDVAQKALATLKAQASMYRIVAPINGTIDQMDLKPGQSVQPGMQGVRIVNLSKLKVKASVAESFAGKVQQGDPVVVTIPDAGDSVRANVSFTSKVIDPASRSFIVEVRLPSGGSLKPNMTAVLRIQDHKKSNALVVPLKAVQTSERGDFVFVLAGGKAKRVSIEKGVTYKGNVEIVSGLNPGDQVLVDGVQDIEDGDPVHATLH